MNEHYFLKKVRSYIKRLDIKQPRAILDGLMPVAVKKKQRSKPQARIYEHTENIEPVATKEFVRQELKPIIVSQGWMRIALLVLFTAVGGLYVLLWEIKTDVHNLDRRMDKRMGNIENRMERIEGKLDILIQRRR